jgi:hypothetical protein
MQTSASLTVLASKNERRHRFFEKFGKIREMIRIAEFSRSGVHPVIENETATWMMLMRFYSAD